ERRRLADCERQPVGEAVEAALGRESSVAECHTLTSKTERSTGNTVDIQCYSLIASPHTNYPEGNHPTRASSTVGDIQDLEARARYFEARCGALAGSVSTVED